MCLLMEVRLDGVLRSSLTAWLRNECRNAQGDDRPVEWGRDGKGKRTGSRARSRWDECPGLLLVGLVRLRPEPACTDVGAVADPPRVLVAVASRSDPVAGSSCRSGWDRRRTYPRRPHRL